MTDALARYQELLTESMSAETWVATHGELIGRAMHDASQVGGPWAPCPIPYGSPECEHGSMGRHVASLLVIDGDRNRFADVMALHDPENMPHGMSPDYYVGWHRAIEAALRIRS